MARSGAGGEQNDIDADVVTRTRIARHQDLGGGSDAGEAAFVDGEIEFRSGAPGLHLDECDEASLAGDQVDLARRRADAMIEHRPALEPQPPAGQPFATTPGGLRGAPFGGGGAAWGTHGDMLSYPSASCKLHAAAMR
jgi:hypothetical protein